VSVDVIKKRGKLIVGTDATWPLWEWVMGDKIVGWDIDIAREIAKALGIQLEICDLSTPASSRPLEKVTWIWP
jgi:polar amino acid transport system substrate-binding protein